MRLTIRRGLRDTAPPSAEGPTTASSAAPGWTVPADVLRIGIVNQNKPERQTLLKSIGAMPAWGCIICAGTITSALAHIRESKVDVLLLGLPSLGMGDVELIGRLKAAAPSVRIIGFLEPGREGDALGWLVVGFSGLLRKPVARRELADALIVARDGGVYLSGAFREALKEQRPGPSSDHGQSSAVWLTSRQREVLALARRGLPAKQIADKLNVSVSTVNNHLAHIYERAGVHSSREAIDKLF